MIKTNLSVLMAERGLKIADLHDKTGISKTTLMALADNTGKGVQFETVDKLCVFFGVTPNDFFAYSPYIFSINRAEDENKAFNDIDVTVKNKYYSKTFYLSFYARSPEEYNFPIVDESYTLWLLIELEGSDSYKNEEFFNIINDLPVTFETDFFNNIISIARNYLLTFVENKKELKVSNDPNIANVTLNKESKILLDIFSDSKFQKMEEIKLK